MWASERRHQSAGSTTRAVDLLVLEVRVVALPLVWVVELRRQQQRQQHQKEAHAVWTHRRAEETNAVCTCDRQPRAESSTRTPLKAATVTVAKKVEAERGRTRAWQASVVRWAGQYRVDHHDGSPQNRTRAQSHRAEVGGKMELGVLADVHHEDRA